MEILGLRLMSVQQILYQQNYPQPTIVHFDIFVLAYRLYKGNHFSSKVDF